MSRLLSFFALLAASLSTLCAQSQGQVQVAVFSINDFHGAFVRNDCKDIPGAPALLQTLDSLKRAYPLHVTVAAGDNFGGSYFYNATHGVLLPVLFNEMGIRLSAIGNHEFDDGQPALANKWGDAPLRPEGWDITYVCANVRSRTDGTPRIPDFAQPVATETVMLPGGRPFRIAFVGLLTSSTPLQASQRKLAGLSFDGQYTAVLDSVMQLPEAAQVKEADLRLLLTHIGTRPDATGQPEWDDQDSLNLSTLNSPLWHGILSAHSHKPVCGLINQARYPIVQGKWHGNYISMLLCTVDTATGKVLHVEPRLVQVTPKARLEAAPARLQELTDSLLHHTYTIGGTPIGKMLTTAQADMPHDRDDKYKQTRMGTLVCASYAEAYRKAANANADEIVVGCSHFGSIRAGFVKGPVSVLDVGEALPFSNRLRVYALSGKQLKALVEFGFHNLRYGYLQTAGLSVERTAEGTVSSLTYTGGSRQKPIDDRTRCIVVADEFITTGGDGYSPDFFPAKQELPIEGLPATTDAFIQYLQQQENI